MIYYETVKSMTLYKAHEIERMEVITENPVFCESPWLKIITREGRTFYQDKRHLDDMQKDSKQYPTEERRKNEIFAPAQK
ncbi:MAG: hypothetical protein IJU87_04690 [Lachnospiraceae bacterium]|nr:hypothetical protein [Lachnospiraceae bacterium]